MPANLTDRTLDLLEDMPPFLAGAWEVQALVDAVVRELDRLEAEIEARRADYFPQTAEALLAAHEFLLGLSVEPADQTLQQRRSTVLSYLRSLKSSGSGLDWEANLTRLIGDTWTYEEHNPNVTGPGSVPLHTIRITIPYAPQIDPPTNIDLSDDDGVLVGRFTYFVTAETAYGETSAVQDSINRPTPGGVQVAWTGSAGATGYRVYRRRDDGSGSPDSNSGPALVGRTTNTYLVDGGASAVTVGVPPAVNMSGSALAYQTERLARQITPAHIDLIISYGAGFLVGVSQIGEEPL